jgi:hypothetical protein
VKVLLAIPLHDDKKDCRFMGVQKISSHVLKRGSKEKEEEMGNPVEAGPSQKKTGSGGKTQAPGTHKGSGKSKATSSASGRSHAGSKGKSNAGSAGGKKVGTSALSRSYLDSSGETVCREVACEGLATSAGYCRLHYIKNWKKIKRKEVILREKKLNQYIEELVAKYPDKYIEAIRQDLANDKDFAKVIYDLDLDEGMDDFDVEGGDSVDSLIDTIKRDFEDEGDAF